MKTKLLTVLLAIIMMMGLASALPMTTAQAADDLERPVIKSVSNVASGVKVTWKKVAGAEKYRVFLKVDGSWKKIGETTATSFTYSNAKAGESYDFSVRAVKNDYTSVLSDAGSISIPARDNSSASTYYNRMIALKSQYPEGTPWTNDNFYAWNGGHFYGGYGCSAFVFMLSDAAFGSKPARIDYDVTFDKVRVGDILRVNGDSHSVIVLRVNADSVVVAEGNYNGTVHWGRTMSKTSVNNATYLLTRYAD